MGIWHSTHIAYGIKLINFCLLYCCVGNVRVFCRVRPQFEDEGPVVTAFPDDFTLRINQSMAAAPVKEFEFDHVYGPHVSQGIESAVSLLWNKSLCRTAGSNLLGLAGSLHL